MICGLRQPRTQKFRVARDEILHQLDLCRKGEITDAELESANPLVNGWRMLDDPLRRALLDRDRAAAGALVSPEERIEGDRHHARAGHCRGTGLALDTVFFMKERKMTNYSALHEYADPHAGKRSCASAIT